MTFYGDIPADYNDIIAQGADFSPTWRRCLIVHHVMYRLALGSGVDGVSGG